MYYQTQISQVSNIEKILYVSFFFLGYFYIQFMFLSNAQHGARTEKALGTTCWMY